MTKASDNAFPSVLVTEGTEPAAPAAGKQRVYIDSTTHHLSRTDSAGDAIDLERSTFTLGPWFIADIPGSATTQGALMYMNTTTAVSQGTGANGDLYMPATGRVVGLFIITDNSRTAGTATARVRIAGTGTAFSSGTVQLNASTTVRNAGFVAFASGVAFTAGQSVGVDVVTSSYTPTTGNVLLYAVVTLDAI